MEGLFIRREDRKCCCVLTEVSPPWFCGPVVWILGSGLKWFERGFREVLQGVHASWGLSTWPHPQMQTIPLGRARRARAHVRSKAGERPSIRA